MVCLQWTVMLCLASVKVQRGVVCKDSILPYDPLGLTITLRKLHMLFYVNYTYLLTACRVMAWHLRSAFKELYIRVCSIQLHDLKGIWSEMHAMTMGRFPNEASFHPTASSSERTARCLCASEAPTVHVAPWFCCTMSWTTAKAFWIHA